MLRESVHQPDAELFHFVNRQSVHAEKPVRNNQGIGRRIDSGNDCVYNHFLISGNHLAPVGPGVLGSGNQRKAAFRGKMGPSVQSR